MGTIFYQISKLGNKERKAMIGFLAFDVIVWNFLIVPVAATQGVLLPQVTLEHIMSIISAFGGLASSVPT
ncbi:hypothetical protein [Enterobacter phage ZX14]